MPGFKGLVTFWGFLSFGGGMSRIRRMAWSGGSLKKGGSPSTISMTMIPETKAISFFYSHTLLLH